MWNGLNLSWPWNPLPLIGLILLCLLYGFAVRHVHKRGQENSPLKKIHIVAFVTAVVLMIIVFLTPLDTIARTQLFSAHLAKKDEAATTVILSVSEESHTLGNEILR